MLVYRLILSLFAPVFLAVGLMRLLGGREGFDDLEERLGGRRTGARGSLWLHGASNGELTSARGLIEALPSEFPDHALIVTANTTSGRDLVRGWGLSRVSARLAPLDYRWTLSRFRRHWRPAAMILLENEIWPNRILTASEPVLYVAARLSPRSAGVWGRFGGLMRRVLGRVDWLSAQDAGSAARFLALGLPEARLGPVISLKPAVQLPPPPAEELARLARVFRRETTFLAASTHDGEDAIILAGFAAARADTPDLRLILAPRHPRRARDIADLAAQAGLSCTIRSQGQTPDARTQVYLVDTLGEMAMWYALAGVTFVGGSLVEKGGHTPYEPAQAGSAILHGPHVANFAAAYAALDATGGAIPVDGADAIHAALAALADPDEQATMAATAQKVLDGARVGAKDLEVIIQALHGALQDRREPAP